MKIVKFVERPKVDKSISVIDMKDGEFALITIWKTEENYTGLVVKRVGNLLIDLNGGVNHHWPSLFDPSNGKFEKQLAEGLRVIIINPNVDKLVYKNNKWAVEFAVDENNGVILADQMKDGDIAYMREWNHYSDLIVQRYYNALLVLNQPGIRGWGHFFEDKHDNCFVEILPEGTVIEL